MPSHVFPTLVCYLPSNVLYDQERFRDIVQEAKIPFGWVARSIPGPYDLTSPSTQDLVSLCSSLYRRRPLGRELRQVLPVNTTKAQILQTSLMSICREDPSRALYIRTLSIPRVRFEASDFMQPAGNL
ncbi:hypothetical protein TOPH_07619 [Tolypocladium ophioglossoides CBS 100239]|uniref:Uncharacterized protein n=1 Tax=Tolypocladium ophioglossoides (strain CBS 100239) TaxID=1163406 RepID=A0A0L0N1S5_TOLOC|nr:hypothetical protein TOPH_07619 [Tolypocladium ophioglossoides CBS 100239]